MLERHHHVSRFAFHASFLALLVLAALAIRIAYNLALHPDGHGPASFVIDEREYFGAAHVLAEGRGFSFFDTALWVRPPLYVMFLAAFVRFFGDNATPVMVAQSALSAATLLPLGWLADRLGGPSAARWAVALGALYLPFTLFAGLLLSETLFVFLFGLALAALLRTRDTLSHQAASQALLWAGASGLLLGLGALTRGTALGFVPLAALWLYLSPPGSLPARSRAAAALVALAACALVLLPWTLRNYAAYGRFVAVDTTGGYNLWLGSVGVRDEERLQADLRPLPGPVEREAFAYARAFENIRADPGFFVAKGLKESLDLWRPLLGAEERQIAGYTQGRVPAWHLFSLLALDDLLYLFVLLLAAAGLILGPPHPLRSLTLLWVLLWVAISFVFFAVTRFRLPVVAALLPWAGLGATLVGRYVVAPRNLRDVPTSALVAAGATALAILAAVVPAIPGSAVRLGVERWTEQAPYREAEDLMRSNRPAEAVAAYRRANTGLEDTRYGLAAALLQTGDTPGALALLSPDEPAGRFEPFIIRAEAARRSGDLEAARALFNERQVRLAGDAALRWAWDHLDPPVLERLDVGSGLETGYVRGFNAPETDADGIVFRWSGAQAEVKNLQAGGSEVGITWSGWRPGGAPPAVATWRAGTGVAAPGLSQSVYVPNDAGFQHLGLPALPGDGGSSSYILETNGFVPGGSDPRLLGVRVSRIEVRK
jgi:4-amino-4-deoxy-L-arabinose transferase-like glycosyltransferase